MKLTGSLCLNKIRDTDEWTKLNVSSQTAYIFSGLKFVLLFFFFADARVILDLLNDLERRLAGHDISNQVSFVVNKYREIMATTPVEATSTTGGVLPPQQASSSDPNSSASRPKTQLFSLNPLNVPVELLNLKKRTPVNPSSQPPLPERTKEAN